MQDYFLKLDYWLFELINQKGSFAWGDQFFPWVTDLHKNLYFKILVIPLIIFCFVKFFKKTGLVILFGLLVAVGVSDFTGSVVKNQVLRLRPFENHEIVATQKSPAGSKSFYSNHTSNMFTLAIYTGNFIPVLRWPLIAIGACVGYSRVYNGVHYPSDVLTGILFGILWGQIFSWLMKKLLQNFSNGKESS